MFEKLLRAYRKKLTNLSGGNRSILLLKLTNENDLDFHSLDYATSISSFQLLEQVVSNKREIKICEYIDSRSQSVNDLSRKLTKLHRKDLLVQEERGAQDLFVAYPWVRGKFKDGTAVNAPLIFFPVTLLLSNTDNKVSWKIQPRKEMNPVFNKSFLLAYNFYNQVSISDDLMDYQLEEQFDDMLSFRNFLYTFLKDSPLEINFNQEMFVDHLQSFVQFKKEDFEDIYKNGELKLYPHVVLGLFPPTGSYLEPDYDLLLASSEDETLEDFMSDKSIGSSQNIIKEEHMFTPFALDASQELAIKKMKGGESLVVQGPPGTGKSQLICNLVSDFISRGKKVLVVCQKRAALDVVYQRLTEARLTDFVSLVHDFRNDRKGLYDQISRQIDQVENFETVNNSLDAIWLEREFLQTARQIDSLCTEFDSFKAALFDTTLAGVTVKEMYLQSSPQSPFFDAEPYARFFDKAKLDQFINKVSRLIPYAIIFEKEEFGWKIRKNFKDFEIKDLPQIKKSISGIIDFNTRVTDASTIFKNDITLLQIYDLVDFLSGLNRYCVLLKSEPVFDIYAHTGKKGIGKKKKLEQTFAALLPLFDKEGIEWSILPADLLQTAQKVNNAISDFKRFDRRIIWHLFSKDKKQIKDLLQNTGQPVHLQSLMVLAQRIQNRMIFEKSVADLSKIIGERLVSTLQDKSTVVALQTNVRDALEAIEIAIDVPSEQIWTADRNYSDFIKKTTAYQHLVKEAAHLKESTGMYLTTHQIHNLCNGSYDSSSLLSQLDTHFDAMVEYDAGVATLLPYESEIYRQVITNKDIDIISDAPSFIINSFFLTWIGMYEKKYPGLRAVSTLRFEQMEEDLQTLLQKKQGLANDIMLMKVREKTYKGIEYNRLNNRVTYRDLQHQCTKKKKVWPIRKLISAFKDELLYLVPCWLASPETVSAIFPMDKNLLDLVIFDEASQCFAEKGLPAIHRASQVVVVGDDKQLQPNDLYHPRWEEADTEDMPQIEIDSLLHLASQYYPTVQLRGHYRSRSLELITFSNEHFYDNQLQLLPDWYHIYPEKPPIEYLLTNGVWEANTNREEANQVASLVSGLLRSMPGKSIGIVTFNIKQKDAVSDAIDHMAMSEQLVIPTDLFVKNIENVQGDERDIIIFSVAYAPDRQGRMQMQFGSLNQHGGENRLNVAVTRAREKVYLITSIMPSQLKTDDTIHPGPKLFKKYLEYAWKVSQGEFVPSAVIHSNKGGQVFLKDKISSRQPSLIKNRMPFADLVRMSGDMPASLILTDDELYYNALSAKEIHGYVPTSLRNKNWKFARIYSRNYWLGNPYKNKDTDEQQINL